MKKAIKAFLWYAGTVLIFGGLNIVSCVYVYARSGFPHGRARPEGLEWFFLSLAGLVLLPTFAIGQAVLPLARFVASLLPGIPQYREESIVIGISAVLSICIQAAIAYVVVRGAKSLLHNQGRPAPEP